MDKSPHNWGHMGLFKKALHLIATLVLAIVLWGEAVYVSSEPITFAWDAVENASYYEVGLAWEGSSGIKQTYDMGATGDIYMLISRPRTGFFTFLVKACNATGCSDWSLSTDPNVATVDDLPRGWRVFFELPAPGEGGIT